MKLIGDRARFALSFQLMAIAAWKAETIRPASLLQSSLTLLLRAIKPLERKEEKTLLKLDAAACHNQTSNHVRVHPRRPLARSELGNQEVALVSSPLRVATRSVIICSVPVSQTPMLIKRLQASQEASNQSVAVVELSIKDLSRVAGGVTTLPLPTAPGATSGKNGSK